MTSKQVKKAHKAANKQPKLSRAEQRRLELEEQERIRKEIENDRQAARARAARERKKEKESKAKEARRKSGRPLIDVRPSQDTIARFVRMKKEGVAALEVVKEGLVTLGGDEMCEEIMAEGEPLIEGLRANSPTIPLGENIKEVVHEQKTDKKDVPPQGTKSREEVSSEGITDNKEVVGQTETSLITVDYEMHDMHLPQIDSIMKSKSTPQPPILNHASQRPGQSPLNTAPQPPKEASPQARKLSGSIQLRRSQNSSPLWQFSDMKEDPPQDLRPTTKPVSSGAKRKSPTPDAISAQRLEYFTTDASRLVEDSLLDDFMDDEMMENLEPVINPAANQTSKGPNPSQRQAKVAPIAGGGGFIAEDMLDDDLDDVLFQGLQAKTAHTISSTNGLIPPQQGDKISAGNNRRDDVEAKTKTPPHPSSKTPKTHHAPNPAPKEISPPQQRNGAVANGSRRDVIGRQHVVSNPSPRRLCALQQGNILADKNRRELIMNQMVMQSLMDAAMMNDLNMSQSDSSHWEREELIHPADMSTIEEQLLDIMEPPEIDDGMILRDDMEDGVEYGMEDESWNDDEYPHMYSLSARQEAELQSSKECKQPAAPKRSGNNYQPEASQFSKRVTKAVAPGRSSSSRTDLETSSKAKQPAAPQRLSNTRHSVMTSEQLECQENIAALAQPSNPRRKSVISKKPMKAGVPGRSRSTQQLPEASKKVTEPVTFGESFTLNSEDLLDDESLLQLDDIFKQNSTPKNRIESHRSEVPAPRAAAELQTGSQISLDSSMLENMSAVFEEFTSASPLTRPPERPPQNPAPQLPPKSSQCRSELRGISRAISFASDGLDDDLLMSLDIPQNSIPNLQTLKLPNPPTFKRPSPPSLKRPNPPSREAHVHKKPRRHSPYEVDLGLVPTPQQPPLSTQAILFNLDEFFPSSSQQAREIDAPVEVQKTPCPLPIAEPVPGNVHSQQTPCPVPEKLPSQRMPCAASPQKTPEDSPSRPRFFTSSGEGPLLALALQRSRRTAALEEMKRGLVARGEENRRQMEEATAVSTGEKTSQGATKPVHTTKTSRPIMKPLPHVTLSKTTPMPATKSMPKPPAPTTSKSKMKKPVPVSKPISKPPSSKPLSDKENLPPQQHPSASQESYGGDWIDEIGMELMA